MFRKSARVNKDKNRNETSSELESIHCHACGQRTPNRITLGSFSSRNGGRGSWAGFSTSDSGYESLDGDTGQKWESQRDEDLSIFDVKPPTRQQTYSSSVYSSDMAAPEVILEPFPMMDEVVEEDDDLFELPPESPNKFHKQLMPPKSRFARLNELPAASPRALMFPDDVFDMNAGIEMEEAKGKSKQKRGRWSKGGSLSSIVFPSKLKKLSKGNSRQK